MVNHSAALFSGKMMAGHGEAERVKTACFFQIPALN
jgi:hypothetical protein